MLQYMTWQDWLNSVRVNMCIMYAFLCRYMHGKALLYICIGVAACTLMYVQIHQYIYMYTYVCGLCVCIGQCVHLYAYPYMYMCMHVNVPRTMYVPVISSSSLVCKSCYWLHISGIQRLGVSFGYHLTAHLPRPSKIPWLRNIPQIIVSILGWFKVYS